MTVLGPPESSSPALSAVFVCWNAGSDLHECLESLAAHPPSTSWEAVVVDNASTDGSAVAAAAAFPWARFVMNKENRGLAAANNQGMLAARGHHVLIANADVVFCPGAVDALLDVLDRRPTAGFVVPRLLYPDGSTQTSAGNLPGLADALLGRQVARGRRSGPEQGMWWDAWAHDTERRIGRGHESCYLVRREALVDVGPQDERYVLDWEGADWTERLGRAGWEVWFTPDARIVHKGGTSIRQVTRRWIISSHRGMYRYYSERRPRRWAPALALAIGGRAALKLAADVLDPLLYERAHRDLSGTSEAPTP